MITYPSAKPFAALAASLLLAGAAQAATYTTEFTGTNEGSFTVGRIEVVWTTSVAVNGAVSVANLSELTFSFYDGSNVLAYSDHAIVGGVVQPIGGVSRTLLDLGFNAVSGVSIQSFDNDYDQIQFGSASGSTYNLYSGTNTQGGPVINIASYQNGTFTEDATFTITNQTTTGASAVPEPSSFAALAGLCGLGLAAAGRRRRA